jgi:hypothetical protein
MSRQLNAAMSIPVASSPLSSQPVDVLRPLALREVALGPREVDVDLGVEGILHLRQAHLFDTGRRS